MSFLNPRSRAEARDSLAVIVAFGTGAVAIVNAFGFLEGYVDDSASSFLNTAQLVGGVLVLVIMLPLIVLMKARGAGTRSASGTGGYMMAAARRAGYLAFGMNLIVLVILSIFDTLVLSRIDAASAVELMISVALGAFSIAFFVTCRFGHIDDDLGDQ